MTNPKKMFKFADKSLNIHKYEYHSCFYLNHLENYTASRSNEYVRLSLNYVRFEMRDVETSEILKF